MKILLKIQYLSNSRRVAVADWKTGPMEEARMDGDVGDGGPMEDDLWKKGGPFIP